MLQQMNNPVLETRCGDTGGLSTGAYKGNRSRGGPYRESERSILFTQPKSGGWGIAEMLRTPESIRTLQRKLYCKAKQEPACRFHALYDKIYREDILSHAYDLVRANKGSAGIDGVTFEDIEAKEGVTAFRAELAEALIGKPGMSGSPIEACMRHTGFTKCQRQQAGQGRMPCGEEHRKAVCGKTACTV